MTKPPIVIEQLSAYSLEDAARLGELLHFESPKRPLEPLSEQVMYDAIDDPADRTIIVARETESGGIVSSESLNMIKSPDVGQHRVGRIAWLGFVCTHPQYRRQGIYNQVWLAGLDWCAERQAATLDFTSNPNAPDGLRDDAIRFYEKHGAVALNTTPYRLDIQKALKAERQA